MVNSDSRRSSTAPSSSTNSKRNTPELGSRTINAALSSTFLAQGTGQNQAQAQLLARQYPGCSTLDEFEMLEKVGEGTFGYRFSPNDLAPLSHPCPLDNNFLLCVVKCTRHSDAAMLLLARTGERVPPPPHCTPSKRYS